jgi:hypothetical protein
MGSENSQSRTQERGWEFGHGFSLLAAARTLARRFK